MSYKKIIFILFLGIFLSAGRNAKAQAQSDTFKYTGSIVTWTVPAGCVSHVTITAIGAAGGTTTSYLPIGGLGAGASITGTFSVTPGEVLKILVGGHGVTYSNGGGGGGGSFVTDKSNNPLCIAGGGGGYAGYTNAYTPVGMDADTGTAGFNGDSQQGGSPNNYGVGGTNGNGATGASGCGGNGGGLLTNGAASNCCGGQMWGTAFINGGIGGLAGGCNEGGLGGFGGGGTCGNTAGGGGGGYSGGGCAYNSPTSGGGGGSYDGGTNPKKIGGFNRIGDGKVILTWSADSVGAGSAKSQVLNNIVCSGNATGSAVILINGIPGGGAFTYTWSPNVTKHDTGTGLLAGTYTVTVTGCNAGSATTTVTITQPTFFVANPTINEIQCYGAGTGSIIAGAIGGTAPYTYVFTPGGNVPFISNLSVGTYSLNVLDSRGCATSKLITISQPTQLVVAAQITDSVICNGQSNGAATVSATGGTYPYNYSWAPNGGTGASASGLSGGTYLVNVTDNNGCKSSSTVTIYQPNPLNVLVAPSLLNLACNGDNNGVLGSGVNGGTRPYKYMWSNNLGTDSNATGLGAGTYTLTVTDAHNCVTAVTATITQPSPLNVVIDSTFNHGYCSGTAWVTLNGGVQPYTYLWSGGSNTYYQNNLCDGLYCCTVTDANGCVHNVCTHITSDLGVGNVTGNDAKITVYPNPNNGLFTIQSTGEGQSTVEVYNVLGEKVYSGMLDANKGNNNTINMSNQPNGVYLYRVISSTNGSLVGEGKVVLEK